MKGVLFTILLLSSVGPNLAEVICEQFATYYTYCDDLFSCCHDNEYCCYNGAVIHVRDETSFSGAVYVGIVFGAIAIIIALVCVAVYVAKRFSKPKRTVQDINVVYVSPAGHAYLAQQYRGQRDGGGNDFPPPYGDAAGGYPSWKQNGEQKNWRPETSSSAVGMAPQYSG